MKLIRTFIRGLTCSLIAAFAALTLNTSLHANDSGDGPGLAADPAADIGDVYFFLDPTDITQTVMIATTHEFLVPGKALDLAAFDENVRYRFEIYNDHVNVTSPMISAGATSTQKTAFLKRIKPNRTIDITFSKREVGLGPQTGTGGGFIPPNLRRTLRQQATVTLGGFPGLNGSVFKTDVNGDALLVTPINLAAAAPNFDVRNVKVSPTATMQFFAGEVDDPFFMDVPALNTYLDGIRNGGAPTASAFMRQRDTFAGYNTLAIAIRIPTVLLLGVDRFLGLNCVTQRHAQELHKATGVTGFGAYVNIDRMGNPLVNSLLIPFDKRTTYNTSNPKGDATLLFDGVLTETLKELGMDAVTPEPSFNALRNIYIAYGDLLQLDTSISNFGSPAGAGYDHKSGGFAAPNGRRLQDDVTDIVLTTINHNSAIGDGVANIGTTTATFPFLGKPNQPLVTGSGADDATRN